MSSLSSRRAATRKDGAFKLGANSGKFIYSIFPEKEKEILLYTRGRLIG